MMNRRQLISSGAMGLGAGILTALTTSEAEAAITPAQVALPAKYQAAGPFGTGGIIAILIGLLLPAVQKVREPARLLLLAGDGSVLVQRALPAPYEGGVFSRYFQIEGNGGQTVRISQGASRALLYEGQVAENQIIAILTGAVSPANTRIRAVSASVQFKNQDPNLAAPAILPFIEQENIY